jgi:pseudouridine synthase
LPVKRKWNDVERLQKYLAACGMASRRESERLIEAGRVTVNGEVAQVGSSVDPARDSVALDGRPVAEDDKVYVLLNKPRGIVTTVKDTHARETVMDCLNGVRARVFPVGRLDMDVEGALLLTNDGELANRLLHPKYEVEKVYQAWGWGEVTEETAAQLASGVPLEDGETAPGKVTILRRRPNETCLRIIIHEGRNREVKRMCIAVGHRVKSLRRIAIGGIAAGPLRPGEWRYLTQHEVASLRRLTAQ